MAYSDGIHTLTFRGSTVNDVTNTSASGFLEVNVAIVAADANPEAIAPELELDGNNSLVGFLTGLRESINVELAPFVKSVIQANAYNLMDGGRARKLMHLLSRPYCWIYRAYKSGTSGDALERAIHNVDFTTEAYDPEDEDTWEFYDRFWDTDAPGELPMAVMWDRESRPEYVGGGEYEWNLRLLKIGAEVMIS